MTDVTEQLHDRLQAAAADLDVPPGNVDDVVRRGRRRRLALRGAGAAGLVLAIGAAVPLVLPDGTPTPTVVGETAPTPTPTPTPDAAPSPTPSPTPDPEPSPTTDTAATGEEAGTPTLLVATDDGIVRWDDGTTTPVPGIDGPVDVAVDDGRGGVVFQRNDIGIGRLADGEVSTIVSLSEFEPRAFDDFEPVPPVALRLWDAAEDRIVYSVVHEGEGVNPPVRYDVLIAQSTVDGSRTELDQYYSWESGPSTITTAAGRTALNFTSEMLAGSLTLLTGGEPTRLSSLDYGGEGVASGQEPGLYVVRGGALDPSGTRMAVVVVDEYDDPGRLVVVDTTTEERVFDLGLEQYLPDLPHGAAAVDFDGSTVLLTGFEPGDGALLVEVGTDDATAVLVEGRPALTSRPA